MFTNKSSLSPESNPIDLLRKYSPYLLGAMVGIAVLSSLYYYLYRHSKDLIETLEIESNDNFRSAGHVVSESLKQANKDIIDSY